MVGLDLTVFVAVNLQGRGSDIHACSARWCWRCRHVVAPSFEAYRRFVLERLLKAPGVKDIRSSFALDVPKEAAPLPLEHLR